MATKRSTGLVGRYVSKAMGPAKSGRARRAANTAWTEGHRSAGTGRFVSPKGSRERSEAALSRVDAAIEQLGRIKF